MEPTRILLVEDDAEIARLLQRYLEKEAYHVTVTDNGEDAIAWIDRVSFDLIVQDLMIPGADGYQVLSHLRASSHTPVLIISAKSDELDKVVGLRLGADDYLGKPFGIAEFIARVKAILRRYVDWSGKQQTAVQALPTRFAYKQLLLNEDTHSCTVDARPVSLTATEFKLLKLFMLSPNKVFTKEEIISAVWKDEYIVDDNKLLVVIRRLRVKIERNPSEPEYIHTVWGVGYKLGDRQAI
ncbi:response regulator transcription factor [Paenibacillus sp. PR3]|uniref:Response regulator transcription factor n=1 Tax=Paenibacillus terricola TaxID=2763503 RepID=A0ABR8N2C5_9BACL|nr:response regulator transcription factor [Paenibacillus terricola]MBD3922318.1 response regulator transcription factor [Paenibacillus terricola]